MGSLEVEPQVFDLIIIGAGLSGVAALHHLRNRFPSWKIRVLEAAPGVGGTWYYNCYPGARVDTESLSYAFSFDKDIVQEWSWKDTFSTQADTLKYVEFVAEKLDLYKDIQFNTRIKTAAWQNDSQTWLFTDDNQRSYSARWYVSCIGFLSSPTLPSDIPGIDSFQGLARHAARWPHDFDMKRDFGGKRIGIIGTSATGIQTTTATAKEPRVKSVTVFQRTATWTAPLHNKPITPEEMEENKKSYDEIWAKCDATSSGFLHGADPRKTFDVSDEERLAFYEKVYSEPGFSKWMGLFSDTYTDRKANELYSAFHAAKIRSRVHDPVVAEALVPKDHGFGTRRVPLESGYFEVFNQTNVHLVDLKKTPIERVTPEGILTSDGKEHELDVIVFATGFSAVTGAFADIEWHGKDNRPLLGYSQDKTRKDAAAPEPTWLDHRPRTFLGVTVPNMPNMFMMLGPHQPFGNAPRSIEHAVNLVADLLAFCEEKGYSYVEPTEEAVQGWTEHVVQASEGHLANEIDSWITGVNKNVKGRSERSVVRYTGHIHEYKRRCRECKAAGWKGLQFA